MSSENTTSGDTKDDARPQTEEAAHGLKLNPAAIANVEPLPLEGLEVMIVRKDPPFWVRAAEAIGFHIVATIVIALFLAGVGILTGFGA